MDDQRPPNSSIIISSELSAQFTTRDNVNQIIIRITDGTLSSSFKGWSSAGLASHGGYLTLNTSESPSDAVESTLSDIVEMDATRK